MNMNKQKISLILLLGFTAFSCSDFLQVNPQGELTQEAFPKTAQDALLATNAVYSTLRSWHYNSGGFPIMDMMSDDAHKGSNPNDGASNLKPYENFTFTTTQDGLDRWWAALYQGVRFANVVLEKVPDLSINEQLKTRYLAEASFLRGLYYFDLVRAFGEVPLVISTTPPLKVAKSSASEIYTLIKSDLATAIAGLPEKNIYGNEDLGRASKGAAKALLAKVYLFEKDYANAERFALEVINSGLYQLEPVFADANGQNGEHGVESVFEVGAVATESGGTGNQYANTQGVRGTPNRGWGFNQPSIDLRNAFETGDPREDATIIEIGEVLDGVTILGDGTTPDEVKDEQGNVIQLESYNQKVWIPGLTTNTQYGHNRRLIRYSDVLLMAAEALNENNKAAQALPYLNEVRARARQGNLAILPNITETGKDALRDLIIHERRVELALEGHRFWDLVRTGKAVQVLGPVGFQTGKHEYFPIPQNEIDISQGSLIQNPAWN
jgi:hypothetical protein